MRLRNNSRQNKWQEFTIVCIGVVCVFSTIFVLIEPPKKVERTGNVVTDFESDNFDSVVLLEKLKLESPSKNLTFEEYLWEVCPVLEWSEKFIGEDPQISKECFLAFGEYMKRESRVFGRDSILQLIVVADPMSYERIFRDPQGDRERVLEALSRPECQFADGELIRWDLKETCNADAFANYVNFLRVCRYEGYLSRWIALKEDDYAVFDISLVNDPWDDLEEEDRLRILKKHLEHSWAHDQCERSGLPNLEFEPHSADKDLYQMLELVGHRVSEREPALRNDGIGALEEYSNKAAAAEQFLLAIAARLGDEWATHEYTGTDRWRLDSWDRYAQSQHPWRTQTTFLKRFQNNVPSVNQIIDAVELALALEDNNVNFDWKYLVDMLCRYTVEDVSTSTNCQTAIELLDQSLEPTTHQRHLSVLSKFRSIALELEIYNNPSKEKIRLEKLY